MTAATAPGEPRTLGHRPGLDGLRGLAVLLVLAYHFGVPLAGAGGRVGVLIFFVLSGLLITWLLLDEQEATGRIDLRAFYIRRARRLLPALAAVLIVVLAGGAATGSLDEVIVPVLWAASYMAYWANRMQVDLEPLGHTWTLSVEEQFYIVWPAVVVLLFARRRLGLVALAGVIGFVVAMMPTTAGAIGVGAATAYAMRRGWVPRIPWAVGWAAIAALVMLSVRTYADTGPPAVAYGAIALSAVAASWAASWPVLRPLRGIGRISYGLYLWHVPVVFALGSRLAAWPWWASVATLTAVTFAVALVSWFLLERRFLRHRRPMARPSAAPAGSRSRPSSRCTSPGPAPQP